MGGDDVSRKKIRIGYCYWNLEIKKMSSYEF